MAVKTGLVLGGGGARGLAHVGVIKVLAEAGIDICALAGSSMGALIGGVYAQNPDSLLLEQKVTSFINGPRFRKLGVDNFRNKRTRDPDDIISQLAQRVKRRLIINLAANRIALLKPDRLRIAVHELLDDLDIRDCKLPFACIAADLKSGQEIILDEGSIRQAVEGSSAIPGFLPPVEYNGYLLIDGSIINNFPVDIVRLAGAQFVIAVDVSLDFEQFPDGDNVIDLVMRSAQITSKKLNKVLQSEADFVIQPEIGSVHWSEFNRVDEVIAAGEKATRACLPNLKKAIRTKQGFFRRWFS